MSDCKSNRYDREVVIVMTDMVKYSQKTSNMTPEEIRDFLTDYHQRIHSLINHEESAPLELEPSAGDGSLIIFYKRHGEGKEEVSTRALKAALRMAHCISIGELADTRMGLLLGPITEATLGARLSKFGGSFSVANRLEELCGYFGTTLLMDREVAKYQQVTKDHLINIAKVSLTSILHPMNIFTIYEPGIHNCPVGIDKEKLKIFITMKNEAMEIFWGNQQQNISANFPVAKNKLLNAQLLFLELTTRQDPAIERILEFIRETPSPASDFNKSGMPLMEKRRDALGERLFHLSKELLRAMNSDFYHALVVDTAWEKYFKLEWCKEGETIIEIGSNPDGIYYLDTGTAEIINAEGLHLSTMYSGSVFGEMAYFASQNKRTATVLAKSDVVLRRISNEDFIQLPIIMKIFEQIATARKKEISQGSKRPQDNAISSSSKE